MSEEALKEATETIKEATTEAASNITDGMDNVKDMKGTSQTGVPVTGRSGKVYWVKPCGIESIPLLVAEVKKIDDALKAGNGNPLEMLIANDNAVIKGMAKVIELGVDDITASEVGKEFTLGTFPTVYKTILDLNDFLEGMRTLYQ
jgi:hypothetical protein